MTRVSCLGVILAGGASKRMGQDKATLTFAHKNLLSHTKSIMQQAGLTEIVVSGNQHQVPDLFPNQGPVSGIISVIEKYQPLSLIALPVDMPLLTSEVIQSLIMAGQTSQKACFYQDHHLPLYLPVNAFTEMATAKAKQQMSNLCLQSTGVKGPSIRALLKNIPQQILNVSDRHLLFNANTPEQWQFAKQQFNKRNKHEQRSNI